MARASFTSTARRLPRAWQIAGAAALFGIVAAIASQHAEAHKAITSKYTFNEHVFPIVRERCARCHYEGGPTPMSLTTYRDAMPWSEAIREQLVAEKMPPWYADPLGPGVKDGHTITTRELDILVTWATGGSPEGDTSTELPLVTPPATWKAGPPDVALKLPAEHALPAGILEDDKEFTLATGLTEEKWVKAVDLMPSERSMVREAVIAVENGPVIAAWVPGHDVTSAPSGTAFRLPAGAKLTVRLHYKKSWIDEQNVKSDQSTVALYFTDAPLSGRSIEALEAKSDAPANGAPRVVSSTLKSGARVLALRPSFDEATRSAVIDAVLPNGRRVTVMQLRAAQPQWYRRYWLSEPIELPAGTKIEMTATPAPVDEFAIPAPKRHPLRLALDLVPVGSVAGQ
jgi:hypothetical protein